MQPSNFTTPVKLRYFEVALGILVIVLLGYFASLLLRNLATGYELGDHGFYLLHMRQPEAISYTLTHFGIVWDFFIGDHGIKINRLLNIVLIPVSAVILAALVLIVTDHPMKRSSVWLGGVIALAGSSTFFASFIVDPTYNSMALILVLLSLALTVFAVEMVRRKRRGAAFLATAAAGALVAALVLTKAPTAVSLAIFLLSVALYAGIVFRSAILSISMVALGLAGFGLFTALFELNTGFLTHVISSFQRGLGVYSSGGTHSVSLIGLEALERLYGFARGCAAAILRGGWMIVLPVMIGLITFLRPVQRRYSHALIWIEALAVLAVFLLAVVLVVQQAPLTMLRNQMITVFVLGAIISVIFWYRAGLTVSGNVLVAGALLAPFLAIFGTTNSYVSQILVFGAGLSLLPAWIVLTVNHGKTTAPAKQMLLALAGFATIISTHMAFAHPYRMGGSLAEANETVVFPGNEEMTVTPVVATFASSLKRNAHSEDALKTRPPVFDLTGQLPIAVHLLNGRPTGAAWFLDAFGARFSGAVFGELEEETFRTGWVLVRQDASGGIDTSAPHFSTFVERIEELGFRFEEHFEKVDIITAPYWGSADKTMNVSLYKPIS